MPLVFVGVGERFHFGFSAEKGEGGRDPLAGIYFSSAIESKYTFRGELYGTRSSQPAPPLLYRLQAIETIRCPSCDDDGDALMAPPDNNYMRRTI